MNIELIPIKETLAENEIFRQHPLCQETLYMTLDYYTKIGFNPPWICYYTAQNGDLVGSAGIKGQPQNQTIEIAYGTFEAVRNQGIGTKVCKALIDLVNKHDSSIKITARTLPESNFSTRILSKNHFVFVGSVIDSEDGEVWEWMYQAPI